MQPLLNIAVNAARQAGDVILRHIELLDRIKITAKGHQNYCSEVDIKAEQAIIHTLRKAYPDHGIVSEESPAYRSDAECVWIIDPLDGTNNYLHGFPFYCVSIALEIKHKIEHAVIYDPLRHECFSASRGSGARLNDRRLRVSKQTQLSSAMIGTGASTQHSKNPDDVLSVHALLSQCANVRRTGSAALDLAYVASGRLDGFFESGLQTWDIAAGSLLIQEAGGLVSDYQGKDDYVKRGDIVAATPKLFKSLLQGLQPK